jgi:lysophospholipase L1-like esterase
VLDDSKTWPALLEQFLGQRMVDKDLVWVANSGIDGTNSNHHLMHAKYFLPQLPHINYVIIYAGANDMGLWFHHKEFDPGYLSKTNNWDSTVGAAFRWSAYTPNDFPVFKRLALWKLASRVKDMYVSKYNKNNAQRVIVQDTQMKWIVEERKNRSRIQAQLLDRGRLETLPAALDSYESVLGRIVHEIRRNGSEPILMTQAVQSLFLSEEERARLWMGVLNEGEGYVSEEQYPAILDLYNQRMKKVARDEHVLLIDLASELERGARPFYDGMHFNEWGAAEAARVVAKFFVEHELLPKNLRR